MQRGSESAIYSFTVQSLRNCERIWVFLGRCIDEGLYFLSAQRICLPKYQFGIQKGSVGILTLTRSTDV